MDYYVDPVNGSTSGDGSAARPWRTVQEVIRSGAPLDPVKEGDTIWLRFVELPRANLNMFLSNEVDGLREARAFAAKLTRR